MIERLEETGRAEPLFAGWEETLIWSCLQRVMGNIYVDNRDNPESAMAALADFLFLAGKPGQELACYKPEESGPFRILVPQTGAWASSYGSYRDGIEIEIDTRKDCRRQGLAFACGAKLILECGKRGLYPSWDAQNRGSLLLAEKLGYHFDREYVAFEVME